MSLFPTPSSSPGLALSTGGVCVGCLPQTRGFWKDGIKPLWAPVPWLGLERRWQGTAVLWFRGGRAGARPSHQLVQGQKVPQEHPSPGSPGPSSTAQDSWAPGTGAQAMGGWTSCVRQMVGRCEVRQECADKKYRDQWGPHSKAPTGRRVQPSLPAHTQRLC